MAILLQGLATILHKSCTLYKVTLQDYATCTITCRPSKTLVKSCKNIFLVNLARKQCKKPARFLHLLVGWFSHSTWVVITMVQLSLMNPFPAYKQSLLLIVDIYSTTVPKDHDLWQLQLSAIANGSGQLLVYNLSIHYGIQGQLSGLAL